MSDFKRVILKDPVTGEYLAPLVGDAQMLGGHLPEEFASGDHNHDSVYSPIGHNHDDVYATKDHTHDNSDSYTKDEILSDAAKAAHGLKTDATPNDVFMKLAMPLNTYGFLVTAKFSDGTIASGLPLPGLLGLDGNVAITDENGIVYAYSETSIAAIDLTNVYGVADYTTTLTSEDGISFTKATITIDKDESMYLITTSGNITICNAGIVDICAVGGGGQGGGNWSSYRIGSGGGGYAVNLLGYKMTTNTLSLTIGAGGSGGTGNTVGGNGGRTTISENGIIIVTAEGGQGGQLNNVGGTGNGNGTGGGAGGDGTVRVFNDPLLPLPGGGGGKGNYAGGKDFGGAGGYNNTVAATNGSVPGGGGGGTTSSSFSSNDGVGGAGGVYLRVRYE